MTDVKTPLVGNDVTTTIDAETGDIEASALFHTTPTRLFRALTTEEICAWWVRPGVFNTQEWSGDVRVGGRWTASGIGGGALYQLAGEFVEVEAPDRLKQTWKPVGAPFEPATLTHELAPLSDGVQLTLRHSGLPNADVRERTRAGWETSLACLQTIIGGERR